jgi:EPS-associated MarR family transcriptional regulator
MHLLMAGQRSKLQEDTHFRILRLLHDNPEWSQRELASAVGISNGGMHYVLNALGEKGLIKLGNFTSAQDKRRYAYVLTPKGISEKAAITRRFLARKVAEYDALRAEINSLREELSSEQSAECPATKAARL